MASESQKRVSEKIRYLRHEGVSQEQAVGEAEGMEHSGRLKRYGKYIHKKHKRKSRRSGR